MPSAESTKVRAQSTLAERLAKAIRRAGDHVVRTNALKALLLVGVSLAFVFGFGTSTAVGQTGLVVIGVLLSYVALPSQQTPVWATTGGHLSRTVPEERLYEASRATSEAIGIQAGNKGRDIGRATVNVDPSDLPLTRTRAEALTDGLSALVD